MSSEPEDPEEEQEEEEAPPAPRQKKVKEEEEPPGAPEWVVTFTDMISLLVTFFVLLMTFSSMEEYELLEVRGALPGNTGIVEQMNGPEAVPPPEDDIKSNTDPVDGGSKPHARPDENLEQADGGGSAQADDQLQIDLNVVGDGLLVQWDETYSFTPGSAEVNPKLEKALFELAEVLRFYPHQVVLEGHATVDHRATATYPDPETMSLARALGAARVLIDNGIEESRIQVTGHGTERPRSVANTAESRHSNRRVELRVLTLGRARAEQLKMEWRERRHREGGF